MPKCETCSVCCTVCAVPDFNKKAGEHCIKNENGCQIYGNHPQVCKDFECAYYQGGYNVELRPDKCGVMFVKKNEHIFCGIINPGQDMTMMAKRQIVSLNKQGYSLVMLKIGERPHIIPASNCDPEEIYKEYVGILNGDIQH